MHHIESCWHYTILYYVLGSFLYRHHIIPHIFRLQSQWFLQSSSKKASKKTKGSALKFYCPLHGWIWRIHPGSLCSFGEATSGTQSGRSKWFATMGSCEDHWETRATSQMARCLGFILATSKHGLRYESLECLDKCLRARTAIMAGRSGVAGMLRRWSLLWCRSFQFLVFKWIIQKVTKTVFQML